MKFLDILLISILQIKPILVNKVIKPHRNTAAELSQEIIKIETELSKTFKTKQVHFKYIKRDP